MTLLDMVQEYTKIAVVGTRGYDDMKHFEGWVKYYTHGIENPCFVSGGAKSGADALIELYAEVHEIPILVYYPNYERHGKGAPLVRNLQIVTESELMIAFWDGVSRGTAHVIGLAREKGILVHVVDVIVPPRPARNVTGILKT